MIRYTPEKIDHTLQSVKNLKQLRIKLDKLYLELEDSLTRIQRAMKKELDFKQELQNEKEIIREQLKKDNPDRDHFSPAIISTKAKRNIMKRYKFNSDQYYPMSEQWNLFIIQMTKQHEKDRQYFIKRKEIEA